MSHSCALFPTYTLYRRTVRKHLVRASVLSTTEASRLRDQTLATLGTTGVDDLAAVGGRHACTEAVGTGALEQAGLESTLHGEDIRVKIEYGRQVCPTIPRTVNRLGSGKL
jgi:hypothetical protein